MKLLIVMFSALTLLGCASSKSGEVYSRDQARTEMNVRTGVIEVTRVVQLEGTRSGVGSVAGAVVGGVAGSNIGGGRGQIIGSVLGAVAGGLAGHAVEQGVTRTQALELTVRLDKGGSIVVVQEAAADAFRPGDRVRVLSGRGETRVAY